MYSLFIFSLFRGGGGGGGITNAQTIIMYEMRVQYQGTFVFLTLANFRRDVAVSFL